MLRETTWKQKYYFHEICNENKKISSPPSWELAWAAWPTPAWEQPESQTRNFKVFANLNKLCFCCLSWYPQLKIFSARNLSTKNGFLSRQKWKTSLSSIIPLTVCPISIYIRNTQRISKSGFDPNLGSCKIVWMRSLRCLSSSGQRSLVSTTTRHSDNMDFSEAANKSWLRQNKCKWCQLAIG